MFARVLIANRGEIVIRIARTLRRLGCSPATVYVREDGPGRHVRCGDVAVEIGSYLDAEEIVDAARRAGAEALHPGYGFLSERAELARACERAGLTWIGPPPAVIELMGEKSAAKRAAQQAGLPVLPGLHRAGLLDGEIAQFAESDGLPLLVKAASGGGGKGMRVVRSLSELEPALIAARREARAAFGDDGLLVERYVSPARHIEVQLLADLHGAILDLGERECSLQRRHQKVIEEAPSPAVDAALRARLGEEAVALARSCGYVGAGTVEFIVEVDAPTRHYFLEMNTRLQVEHAVTESVLGIDLVEWQLRIAAGERLELAPVTARGHAVEARIYAEDPRRGFLPASGRLLALALPSAPGVRVDAGVAQGDLVSPRYDPMIAKVVAHAPTRDAALARLRAALEDTLVLGVRSNVGFLLELLADEDVLAGRVDTELVERLDASDPAADAPHAAIAAMVAQGRHDQAVVGGADPFTRLAGWRLSGISGLTRRRVTIDGARELELALGPLREEPTRALVDGDELAVALTAAQDVDGIQRLLLAFDGVTEAWSAVKDGDGWWVGCRGRAWQITASDRLAIAERDAGGELRAPMPGSVVAVHAAEGTLVARGDVVLVMESMKMELQITAPLDGTIVALCVGAGDQVALGTVLASVAPTSTAESVS
jgi:acetyl-CoA/propionyl-CoA carboxylase biotin carboxyl carrier protein